MANYDAYFNDLIFSQVKHHRTGASLQPGDIKSGDGQCGVVHLHDIEWKASSNKYNSVVYKAKVDLWLTPFRETNEEASKSKSTDHRLIMEELKLWERFQDLCSRACHRDGRNRGSFDVTHEGELFYGFTRKGDKWFSTSCTLNSWILPMSFFDWPGKDNSGVVLLAGERGTDKSKVDMINLMPMHLWDQVLTKLERLTPYDSEPWSYNWADSQRNVDKKDAPAFKEEELFRMRILINRRGVGSRLYWLNLDKERIGGRYRSPVEAVAKILVDDLIIDTLQILNLESNSLDDGHIRILSPVLERCSKLSNLNLSYNQIEDDGLINICNHFPRNLASLALAGNHFGGWGLLSLLELIENTGNVFGNVIGHDKIKYIVISNRSTDYANEAKRRAEKKRWDKDTQEMFQPWKDLINATLRDKQAQMRGSESSALDKQLINQLKMMLIRRKKPPEAKSNHERSCAWFSLCCCTPDCYTPKSVTTAKLRRLYEEERFDKIL